MPTLARLADLAPIDLPTLVAAGALQTRIDRKYLVAADQVPVLLGRIAPMAQVLQIEGHRRFSYATVYFDTPELASYVAATRRRRHRYKVRTRAYLDTDACWLEVKTKDARRRTVKVRTPHPIGAASSLAEQDRDFVAAALGPIASHDDVARLVPTLSTHYQRTTLFLQVEGARVTLDSDLVAQGPHGTRLRPAGLVIVETKSGSAASSMDRLLWRLGHRPVKVSKYATSLAALHPQLPASKWRPALRVLQEATP